MIDQLLFSVSLLHDRGLPHVAINPSNILLTHDNMVYLTDFGIICPHFYLNQDLDQLTFFNPKIDRYSYFAPEIFVKDSKTKIIDFKKDSDSVDILMKADMFSLGCVLFQILSKDKILFNH